MNGPFVWLSGADPSILQKCTHLGRTERIRFGGIGTLVLIPAILALFSMSYAISTIAGSPHIYIGAGFVWAVIVLLVDRYLVSTIYKSKVDGIRGRLVSIAVRYIFAIVVGIAVAHPLVLLWFNDSIVQTIDQNRRDAVSDRISAGEEEKSALAEGSVSTNPSLDLIDQRNELTATRNCFLTLQTLEQSGTRERLPCGESSGLQQCGPRCISIGNTIRDLNDDIAVLNSQIAAGDTAAQEATGRLNTQRDGVDERTRTDVTSIEQQFSYDYLARVNALEQISSVNSHISLVTWFIILFFVFVDILPITMKIATPAGEYEEVRDTLLMERRALDGARRTVLESGKTEKALAEASAASTRIMAEASALYDVNIEIAKRYGSELVAFERKIREIRAEASDNPEIQPQVEEDIVEMREINSLAWQAVWVRLRDFLKR